MHEPRPHAAAAAGGGGGGTAATTTTTTTTATTTTDEGAKPLPISIFYFIVPRHVFPSPLPPSLHLTCA